MIELYTYSGPASGIIGMLIGLGTGYAVTSALNLPLVISALTLLLPFAISATIDVIIGLSSRFTGSFCRGY